MKCKVISYESPEDLQKSINGFLEKEKAQHILSVISVPDNDKWNVLIFYVPAPATWTEETN